MRLARLWPLLAALAAGLEQREQGKGKESLDESQGLVEHALLLLSPLQPAEAIKRDQTPPGLLQQVLKWTRKGVGILILQSRSSEIRTSQPDPRLAKATDLLTRAASFGNHEAASMLADMNLYGNFTHARNVSRAVELYRGLADAGDPAAQSMMGFFYATGYGNATQRDQGLSLLYHTFAAKNKDPRSIMTLAFRYYSGIGTPQKCDTAVVYYKLLADMALEFWNDGPPGGRALPRNTYRLADDIGGIYGFGASVSSVGENAVNRRQPSTDSLTSVDDILDYLRYMAEKNDLGAQFSLARLYYEGSRTIERDHRRAMHYFKAITRQYWDKFGKVMSTQTSKSVQVYAGKCAGYIGRMYLRGEGVAPDVAKAYSWYKKGVENGDMLAQNGLGYLHYKGLGVAVDMQKAMSFFKAAADQDFSAAQANLGKIHMQRGELAVAVRYFELAARHGHIEALYHLAEINNEGRGRERSCAMASAYYKTIAERVEELHSPLAWAHEQYLAGDKEMALLGFLQAAEAGYESAQANVAFILDQNISNLRFGMLQPFVRPHDPEKEELSLVYWTRAARQSNIDALVKMGDHYVEGLGIPVDHEKAAACYNAAAEYQQSALSYWNLGWMHENGIGVEQDFHLAKRFYDQAFSVNREAYLPVTLSLIKLRARSIWNYLSGGSVNGIGADVEPAKEWSFAEFVKKWYERERRYYDDDSVEPEEGWNEYYDEVEGDFVETLVIFALCAALLGLLFWRQTRAAQAAQRQRDQAAQPPPTTAPAPAPAPAADERQEPQPQPQPPGDGGLFPNPDNPVMAQWMVPH